MSFSHLVWKLKLLQISYYKRKANQTKVDELFESIEALVASDKQTIHPSKYNDFLLLFAEHAFDRLDVCRSEDYLANIKPPLTEEFEIRHSQLLIKLYSKQQNKPALTQTVAFLVSSNPQSIYALYRYIFNTYTIDEFIDRFVPSSKNSDQSSSDYLKLAMVRALLDKGEDSQAQRVFESLQSRHYKSYNYVKALVLFSENKLADCKRLLIKSMFTPQDFAQKFWLYVHINIVQGNKSLVNVLFQTFKLNPASKRYEAFYRRVAMLNEQHSEVFKCVRFSQALLSLKEHLGEKYGTSLNQAALSNKKVLILPIWGIGDELMVCGIYNQLNEIAKENNIELWFATEPRLHSIYARSFKGLNFIVINRKHKGPVNEFLSDDELKNPLPDLNLYLSFDNDSWRKRDEFDAYIPLPMVVSKFLKDKKLQLRQTQLHADPVLRDKYINYFSSISSKPKIGFLWKSSILNDARSIHYTKLENWQPIFELKDELDFICLQYGQIDMELEQVSNAFGVQPHRLDNIDLYNDFESLSAIITALDVVIAPSGVACELAAALGTKVLFMMNSAEGAWRKKSNNEDIWFNSIQFVTPDDYGNQQSLIYNTAYELANYLNIEGYQAN